MNHLLFRYSVLFRYFPLFSVILCYISIRLPLFAPLRLCVKKLMRDALPSSFQARSRSRARAWSQNISLILFLLINTEVKYSVSNIPSVIQKNEIDVWKM